MRRTLPLSWNYLLITGDCVRASTPDQGDPFELFRQTYLAKNRGIALHFSVNGFVTIYSRYRWTDRQTTDRDNSQTLQCCGNVLVKRKVQVFNVCPKSEPSNVA